MAHDPRLLVLSAFADSLANPYKRMIPKKFKLGGVTWTVSEVPRIAGDNMGYCNMYDAQIQIVKHLKQDIKEQTFAHELVHALLFATGRMEHDEQLVDSIGVFLHQYLKQQ